MSPTYSSTPQRTSIETAAGTIVRTEGRLADGRAIIFFDDRPETTAEDAVRTIRDDRPLEPRMLPPHDSANIRIDPLTGDPVVIAAHRQNRTFMPPADQDPLAPTLPGRHPTEVPEADYDVVVFENRFPSLQGPLETLVDTPLRHQTTPAGRCEVVCFTSDTHGSFAELSPHRVRTVIEAWADRTAALGAREDVVQVFPFENRGEEIGVTLSHPHGQIYAYSALPPYTAALERQAAAWAERGYLDLLGDVLQSEIDDGERIVVRGEHWVGFVPYAAKWPVELMLMPLRAVPDFAHLDEAERAELAELYPRILAALDRYFDRPLPYISGWHQVPVHRPTRLSRMFLDVFSLLRAPDKMKYLAGSESAMGAWISDTTPERIAARLRESIEGENA